MLYRYLLCIKRQVDVVENRLATHQQLCLYLEKMGMNLSGEDRAVTPIKMLGQAWLCPQI